MSRFLLCFLVSALFAEEAPLTLPPAAKDFLPKGWKVLELASADLNADGLADLVFVREEEDPKKIVKRLPANDGVRNYNPRVLVVLLAEANGYRELGEYAKLIPPAFDDEREYCDDRFDGITGEKGVLTIGFRYWTSAGSGWSSLEKYKFRLESGRLRLIGSELDVWHRSSEERFLISTNHLNGKVKRTTGLNHFDEAKSKPEFAWSSLPSRKPIYIEDLPPCAQEP